MNVYFPGFILTCFCFYDDSETENWFIQTLIKKENSSINTQCSALTYIFFIFVNLIFKVLRSEVFWKVVFLGGADRFNCLFISYCNLYLCVLDVALEFSFNSISLVLDQVSTGQITGTRSIICTCQAGSCFLKVLSTIFFTWFSEKRSKCVVGSYTLPMCLHLHHAMDGTLSSELWNHDGPSWKRRKESNVGGAEILETIPGFVNRKKTILIWGDVVSKWLSQREILTYSSTYLEEAWRKSLMHTRGQTAR